MDWNREYQLILNIIEYGECSCRRPDSLSFKYDGWKGTLLKDIRSLLNAGYDFDVTHTWEYFILKVYLYLKINPGKHKPVISEEICDQLRKHLYNQDTPDVEPKRAPRKHIEKICKTIRYGNVLEIKPDHMLFGYEDNTNPCMGLYKDVELVSEAGYQWRAILTDLTLEVKF